MSPIESELQWQADNIIAAVERGDDFLIHSTRSADLTPIPNAVARLGQERGVPLVADILADTGAGPIVRIRLADVAPR